jgi:hypothetical protein
MPTLKKLIIFSVSLIACFFIGIAIDLACGPEEDPYDYHISFFHNNIQGAQGYGPFYFTNYPFLYDDTEPADEEVVNTKEWAAYLGAGVKLADVNRMIYGQDNATDILLNKNYLKLHRKLPDSLKNNTFLQALISSKQKAALKYYRFAKEVEGIAYCSDIEKWELKATDNQVRIKAANTALKNALTENDRFIRLRYLYQSVRLFHYGLDYRDAADTYRKYIAGYKSSSHAKGWALAVNAGAERRLGDTIKAAYHFSKVFALCPERRVQAYKNYHYINPKENDVIRLAKNPREKAFIYAIEAFNNPDLDLTALKKVYKNYPQSDMVGVMLTREVNKLEDYYLTPKYSKKLSYKPYRIYFESLTADTKRTYHNYTQQLESFCRQLSADGKYKQPALGKLTLAYLLWMEDKTREGNDILIGLKNEPLSSSLNNQRHIIELLLAAQSIKKLDSTNQGQLLNGLKWLNRKAVAESKAVDKSNDRYSLKYKPQRFAVSERDFYQFVLAPAYLKQGDTAMAALAVLKSRGILTDYYDGQYEPWSAQVLDFWQYYLTSSSLNKIINWKHHQPADAYLNFLTSGLKTLSGDDLNNLLGTIYLREHRYQKAVNALSKVQPHKKTANGQAYYYGDGEASDPFVDQVNDYPKVYFSGKDPHAYSKLDFAKAMLKLQKQATAKPQNASGFYYKMATGLYNTSFYGNSSYLISYSWSAYDYARRYKYNFDNDYIKAITAEKYFLKARDLSRNKEFKARCTFMAAKCRQKQITLPGYDDYSGSDSYNMADNTYQATVRHNPYFTELKNGYPKTNFYKIAVNECSYFRDFLSPNKKIKN